MNTINRRRKQRKILDLTTPCHPDMDLSPFDPILNATITRSPAPEPRPTRDWDTLDSMLPRWDRAAFEDALINNPDDLHRDAYTIDKHLAAWDATEELHQWARRHNPGAPKENGIFLYSGGMGDGKSLSMTALAWRAWAFQAIPVLSNMSLRFGYVVSGAAIYSAIERAPAGTIVLLDEIAALMDSFSGNSNRGRTVSQSLTAFRKKQVKMLVGSANEQGIHPDIRRNCRATMKPVKVFPRKRLPSGAIVPAKEGELPYPPFCYIENFALNEPWEGVRIIDDAIRISFTRYDPSSKPRDPYKHKWLRYAESPAGIYNAAALTSDTLDRVPIGDNLDILRDAMTADRANIRAGRSAAAELRIPTIKEVQRNPNPIDFCLWWVNSERDFKPGGSDIPWKRIKERADKHGVSLTQSQIQKELKEAGCQVSRESVSVANLLNWAENYRPQND